MWVCVAFVCVCLWKYEQVCVCVVHRRERGCWYLGSKPVFVKLEKP